MTDVSNPSALSSNLMIRKSRDRTDVTTSKGHSSTKSNVSGGRRGSSDDVDASKKNDSKSQSETKKTSNINDTPSDTKESTPIGTATSLTTDTSGSHSKTIDKDVKKKSTSKPDYNRKRSPSASTESLHQHVVHFRSFEKSSSAGSRNGATRDRGGMNK